MSTLREARKAKGLTQKKLGKKLGFNGQFVSNIERGICALPVDYCERAAKILGVQVDDVFSWHMDFVIKSAKRKMNRGKSERTRNANGRKTTTRNDRATKGDQ